MANALATLFGDIAAAIKAKNGEEGVKYKPIEFPAKIASIPEAKDPKLIVQSGKYEPTTIDAVTITHNLGVLPDVVIVFLAKLEETITLTGATNTVGGQICYSTEAMEDGAVGRVYNIMGSFVSPGNYSVYDDNKELDAIGCVRGATPRTFKIGGSTAWPVKVGATYNWVAIGGLKVHPTYLDLRLELDGDGGLIVHGGVPGIKQLEIYADGALAKTVDYVHGSEFRVDISDVAAEVKEYTISVKPIGNGLDTAYKYQFAEPVTGWVLPKARGTCGENVTWALGNDGTLTIKGSGAMTDYAWLGARPWDTYNNQIKNVVVKDGVTNVGKYAFDTQTKTFPNLESVTLAPSVKTIGNTAFYQCASLKNVTISEGLETIGADAFLKTGITRLSLPSTIRSMGNNAFKNCTSLEGLNLAEGITTLANDAFYGCAALKSVVIPNSLQKIPQNCFRSCTALSDVIIGEGVTEINSSAFRECAMTSVVIPDSVTTIGSAAFNRIATLTSVTIGSGVVKIESNAFYGTALTSAVFKITSGWKVSTSSDMSSSTSVSVANASTAATYLKTTHVGKYWARS